MLNENSEGTTHRVGEKKSNRWGLFDMHGNVCEWCEDIYVENDSEVELGTYRVFRGGAFGFDPNDCRSSRRNRLLLHAPIVASAHG